jgi:hypothetical protein
LSQHPNQWKESKKNSSNQEAKNQAKNTSENHENVKHYSARYEMIQSQMTDILMQIKSLQGVKTTRISSHSLEY